MRNHTIPYTLRFENQGQKIIIYHIGFGVSDFQKSKDFYVKSLKPLGIALIREEGDTVGFGKGNKAVFWFGPNSNEYKKNACCDCNSEPFPGR